jgi:hypothetical protein
VPASTHLGSYGAGGSVASGVRPRSSHPAISRRSGCRCARRAACGAEGKPGTRIAMSLGTVSRLS